MNKILKVTEQTSWQLLGKITSALSSFLVLSLIARNYSSIETGIYTLVITYLTMFFIGTDLGLNAYAMTEISHQREVANLLLNLRLIWSTLLVLILIAFISLVSFESESFRIAAIIGSGAIIANAIFNSTSLIFQYYLKFNKLVVSSSIGSILTLLIVFILVQLRAPISLFTLGVSLGWMMTALLSLLLVRDLFKFSLIKVRIKDFIHMFSKTWAIAITLVLNVVYFRFDVFLLSYYKGFTDVAIYNIAYTLFQLALVVPTFITNSYFPIIVQDLENPQKLFKDLRLAIVLMFGIAMAGTILTFILSPLVISLWVGDKFLNSVSVIEILSLSFPAFFITGLLMWVLFSFKKYQELLYIYFFGLIVNVFLNLIYIPKYSYIASSWITVFSEYVILILELVLFYYLNKKRWT